MAVEVIDKIKPKNGGSFPIVEAVDVEVSEGQRLPEALAAKANAADVTETTDNLQEQIDQIAQAAGAGTADTEIAQARVNADGTSYNTLKARCDADYTSLRDDIGSLNCTYSDGYYNCGGTYITEIVESEYYKTVLIPVTTGQQIKITGSGMSAARLWATANINKKIIRRSEVNLKQNDLVVTIEDGEKYFVTNTEAWLTTRKCEVISSLVEITNSIMNENSKSLVNIEATKADRSHINQFESVSNWWKNGDLNFESLSENVKTDLLKIIDFKVKAYTPDVSAWIYDASIEADGSFSIAFGWTCIDGSSSFRITLPASDVYTTYTHTNQKDRCKVDVSITYKTENNTQKTILSAAQKLYVSVDYSGASFDNGNFDNRIISKVYKSDDVQGITLLRTQNVNPTTSGSTFWYYTQYEIALKDGTSVTISKSSMTAKSGIIEENLENYAVLYLDADLIASYGVKLQTINTALDLTNCSYYYPAGSARMTIENNLLSDIENNLLSDGVSNLAECEIYKNGVSSLDNYGQDNVRYRFKVGKTRKNIHLFFKFQWTSPPVYVEDSLYYEFARVYGTLVKAVAYFRKISSSALRRNTILASYNGRVGSVSHSVDEKNDSFMNGDLAFTIQYTGNEAASASSDIVCRFNNGTITFSHSTDSSIIGTVSYSPTDTIDSLIASINNEVTDITAEAIETTGHTCAELLLSEEDVTFTLCKSYTDDNNNTVYDYMPLGIYYSLDKKWHTCEIIVDFNDNYSYVAFDGRTIKSPINLNVDADQHIEIGGTFNGTETPIRVRDLVIHYDSFGDAEIVQSVAPPYSSKPQLISNHNPKLLIFEGHGVDVGVDAEAPYSNEMAVTTDRLNRVFAALKAKGYVPVTWQQIIDWKLGIGELPKRCYNLMMDDWRFENYVDYDKRRPFEKYNVKAGLAVVPSSKALDDTVEINGIEYQVSDVIKMVMTAGWYPCSHTYNHRNCLSVKPSQLLELFKEDVLANNAYGIYSDVIVYPYGGFNAYVGRIVELSAFKIGVDIVINTYNCRLTNNANLGRVEIGTRESLENVLSVIV